MDGRDLIEKEKKRADIIAKIHAQYPNTQWPTPILEPIHYGRLKKHEVIGRKLMLDKETGNQFDIVSNQYELIYHEEVLHKLLNAIPEEFGKPNIGIVLFKNGARANFTAIFPEIDKDFSINNSPTDVEYRLKNSYDRSAHLKYSAGLTEEVCTNGLRSFREKERSSAKHIGQTISSFQLGDKLKASLETISKSHKIWINWAERKLNKLQVQELVEVLPYSEKEQEVILTLPLKNHGGETLTSLKKNNTIWSVYSAGTQMVHELKSPERKLEIEEQLPNIIKDQVDRMAA